MQSLETAAKSQSTADVRFPTALVRVSWKKVVSSGTLAVVNTSLVDGLDLVAGSASAALPWDSFVYTDESEYALGFTYDRQIIEPQGGIAGAFCEVIFDNTGKRFVPDFNNTIGTAIIDADRPLIVDAGFIAGTSRTVPVFKGSTYGDVNPDYMSRTARVRAADIITLLEQTTLASATYVNQRSDQVIADILADAGIGTAQYSLDVGLNTPPFAWFPSSMNALRRIRKLCEAEEATFYQDERGKLQFKIRTHYSSFPFNTSQITLNNNDMIAFERVINTRIINRVVVKSLPRQVDADTTAIWEQSGETEVDGSSTKTFWAHPTEGDSSIPLIIDNIQAAAATTDYTAFTAAGGGGVDITGDQTVTFTNFGDAVKMVLANANVAKAFYNKLQFRGKAGRVQRSVQEVSEDSASIVKYGVREYTIDNDFIQTSTWAKTIADGVLAKYKDPTKRIRLTIPALPHLELKDRITVTDPDLGTNADYRVMRISGKFVPGSFTQDIILREIDSSETAT